MNNRNIPTGIPIPMHMSHLATQSLCYDASMYQQHTYVDRNRVYYQEHVSQSSWAMTVPHQQLVVQGATFMGNVHIPTAAAATAAAGGQSPHAGCGGAPATHTNNTHFTPQSQPQGNNFGYIPQPQYFTQGGANSHGYSQMFAARSTTTSCNVGGIYMSHYMPTTQQYSQQQAQQQQHQPPPQQQQQPQHQIILKRSCDVATQANLITNVENQANLITNVENQLKLSAAREMTVEKIPGGGGGDGSTINTNNNNDHHHHNRASSSSSCAPATTTNSNNNNRRNSEMTLPNQRIVDMTRICLQGSEIAEKLANIHRHRPCFKKVDTLCARLKQDLLRADCVLPNINSQGIAWAVKDFIFVFTRIINSWVILKGYVYSNSDGLNKIKDELPHGFMPVFDEWQVTTKTLIEMIIKSFVSLDNLLQKQKNSFAKLDIASSSNNNSNNNNYNNISSSSNDNNSTSDSSTVGNNTMTVDCSSTPNKLGSPPMGAPAAAAAAGKSGESAKVLTNQENHLKNIYTMIEDSEETQRTANANGTYFKTGTYTPLKKCSQGPQPPGVVVVPPVETTTTPSRSSSTTTLPRPLPIAEDPPLPPPPPPPAPPQPNTSQSSQSGKEDTIKSAINPFSYVVAEVKRDLNKLADRLMTLDYTSRFFHKHFVKNYYPDLFECHENEFRDVRTIILRCENADYQHVNEAVHDLRRISFVVRNFLKTHRNDDLLLHIEYFENAVDMMLAEPPNRSNQYDHIFGRTGEKLFHYTI